MIRQVKTVPTISEVDLWGGDLSDEQRVTAAVPSAHIRGGHHGKVWISDGEGNMLSGVGCTGTREKRRADVWKQAAERLGVLVNE